MKIINTLAISISSILLAQTSVNQASWPDKSWKVIGDINLYAISENPTEEQGADKIVYKDYDDYDHFYLEGPVMDLSTVFDQSKTNVYVEFNLVHPLPAEDNKVSYLMVEYWKEDQQEWVELEKSNFTSENYQSPMSCDTASPKKSTSLDISSFTQEDLENFRYRFKYFDNGWSDGFCLSSPALYAEAPEDLSVDNPSLLTLKLSPNPSSDFINIIGLEEVSKVSIVNLMGVNLMEFTIENEKTPIDIRKLPKGVYILKLENSLSFEFIKD